MRGPLAALLCITAMPVAAQDLTADEGAVLSRILSAIPIEISGAHLGQERAVLLDSASDQGMADLVIIAGVPDDRAGQVIAVARGIAFSGGMAGQSPWLEAAENGSLLLRSEQIGIGRNPWEMTLTLAERGGDILVAGLTFATWERLTAGSVTCDWNLLAGNWDMSFDRAAQPDDGITGASGREQGREPRRVTIAEWAKAGDQIPDFCRHDFGD